MTLKTRFNLLLAALCLVLATGLTRLWVYERREFHAMVEQAQRQRQELLDRLVELRGLSLKQFADDYSLWDETVHFLAAETPDPEWAQVNLAQSLASFDTQALWVLRPDGALFHFIGPDDASDPAIRDLPRQPELLGRLQQDRQIHFFQKTGGKVWEIRGAVVTASDDRARAQSPAGFLLAGRIWGPDQLAGLAEILSGRPALSLEPHDHPRPSAHRDATTIHLHYNLTDWRDRPVAVLQVDYDISDVILLSELDAWESVIFFFYGALAIVLVVYFTRRWVLRPLDGIGASLSSGDLTGIAPLLRQKSELGRVANLMRQAAQDRLALQATLDERARLGRDLHDGVIQTLYASGMNLASARALLEQDPAAAAELLEQTRGELNAIIRDMRSFITRLEPVTTHRESFGSALHGLSEFMQAVQPARYEIAIDEALAAALPMDTRTQLLHMAREALSNALRHGGATRIGLTLRADGAEIVFIVADNGRGFDPAAPAPGGRGLENLAQRARELAGSLDIRSQTGHGTTITLRFNAPK